MAYETVAAIYDSLMRDVDYAQWARYLDGLLKKHHCPGKRLLDLGCGTGNISIPLAQMGYQVTALDDEAEMLEIAEKKSAEAGVPVDWRQQDITDPELGQILAGEQQFDAVIATFDVFNHLTEPEDLQTVLYTVERLLMESGVLIFDVQTPYKLREYLGDHIFTWHSPDVEYMWENHFDQETQICQMEITFFQRCENGLYRRKTMYQEERLYELELLKLWLNFSNLELLGVYRELSEEAVASTDHRAVFVARPMRYADLDAGLGEPLDFAEDEMQQEMI